MTAVAAGTGGPMPGQRDRCPGVVRLHEAADGLLARVRLVGGRISADQLRAVADAADLGNGAVELTSRASLQIRGLQPGARLGELLGDVGLLPSPTHERVRNILASPVAGRHRRSLADTDQLVTELDLALCADPSLAELSGRFLFAVDDGAGLTGHAAHVTILAVGSDRFRVGTSELSRAGAVRAALDQARAYLPERLPGLGARHARPTMSLPLGALEQRDGRIALTAMPRLGRLDPTTLRGLAVVADTHRAELRVSAARTLTLVDIPPAGVASAEARLSELGLITDPTSGWFGLSACSGQNACTAASFDARAAAAARAAQRRADDQPEHWAGCRRSCGLPDGARLMGV